jgi:diguanylate cyclase (GGDEF)-like protein
MQMAAHPRDCSAKALEWIQALQEDATFEEMGRHLVELLPWRVVGIYRVTADGQRLNSVAIKGYGEVAEGSVSFSIKKDDTMATRAFVAKKSVRLDHASEEAANRLGHLSRQWVRHLNIETIFAVPLIYAGTAWGAILCADGPAKGDSVAIEVVEMVAPIVAAMLQRQSLLEALDSENQALRVVQEWTDDHLFGTDMESLWQTYRNLLIQEGGVRGGTYCVRVDGRWLVQDVFGELVEPYSRQIAEDLPLWMDTRAPRMLARGQRLLWTPAGVNPLPPYVQPAPTDIRGLFYLIADDGNPLAAITLYAHADVTALERTIPSMLHSFSLAFRVIEQRSQMADQLERDLLTGALNRYGMERRMEEIRERGLIQDSIFMMADLDNFKSFNDSYGHQRGDDILRSLVQYLHRTLRPGDWVARIGGDEFMLFLPDRPWNDAFVRRIAQTLSAVPLQLTGLCWTMGAVLVPKECANFGDCYRLADERMYIGKRAGKNILVGPHQQMITFSGYDTLGSAKVSGRELE